MVSTLDRWYLSGPLGLGTPTPAAQLSVSSAEPHLRIDSSGDRAVVQLGKAGALQWDFGVGTGAGNNDLWFGDFSGYRMILQKGTGNVGIGTASMTSKLHVKGNAGVLSLEGNDHAYIQWYPDGLTAGRRAWTGFGSSTDNNLTISNEIAGGNVVLRANGGSTLMVGNAVVGSGGNGSLRLRHVDGKSNLNDDVDALHLNWGTGKPVVVGNPQALSPLHVYGGSLLALSGGNVGIGTNSPTAKLHVNGGAIIGGIAIGGDAPGVNYPYEYETIGVSNPAYNLRLQSPNAIVLHPKLGGHIETTEHFQSIFRCADFLIGAAGRRGSPGRALVDNGKQLVVNFGADWPNSRVEGNFTHGSSRTTKQDIVDLGLEDALKMLGELNPVAFSFRSDPNKNTCLGFIAEEVPDEIGSEDRKGVSPMAVLAVLVKAVQQQMKTVEAMAERMDRRSWVMPPDPSLRTG